MRQPREASENPPPHSPVSGRMLPLVLLALLGVALAGLVVVPQVVGGWLDPSGAPPWAPDEPARPSVSAGPPSGFTVSAASGTEVARFDKGASTVSVLLDLDRATSGSAQLACLASLSDWAGDQGVDGDVERTSTAKIGTQVASGVRLDADGVHAVQYCAWLDTGGLISVRGTSPSGEAPEVDAAVIAVASGVTLR